jgi:hypothetical protein
MRRGFLVRPPDATSLSGPTDEEPPRRVLTHTVQIDEPQLRSTLGAWPGHIDPQSGEECHLPPELVEHVVSFLMVPVVDMGAVRAVGCSSIASYDGDDGAADLCALSKALDPSTGNWWISEVGSTPGGVGAEWISFRLSGSAEGGSVVRVAAVHMQIPPLPSGPLSVRNFHLESADAPEGPWAVASCDLTTRNVAELQAFELSPPIEAACVRIVCTRNAARAAADELRAKMVRKGVLDESTESDEDRLRALHRMPSSIGFFSVRFS